MFLPQNILCPKRKSKFHRTKCERVMVPDEEKMEYGCPRCGYSFDISIQDNSKNKPVPEFKKEPDKISHENLDEEEYGMRISIMSQWVRQQKANNQDGIEGTNSFRQPKSYSMASHDLNIDCL